jgi:ATP-dependent RNA helicase RhlE
VYGGINTQGQIANLRKGAEIIVACPGRLLDLLKQKVLSLKDIEILVLDEADHMFDMGFLPDLKRILRHIPSKRQTLLFSATMPQSISRLAYSTLKNPCRIEIDYTSPLKSITHFLFPIKQHLKTSLLLELLNTADAGSTLIFTRTKRRARSLGEKLKKKGFSAIALQGNLSQNKRQAALKGFKDGTYQIMVATDIAARGIDVLNITHVINFDIPDTPEAYTHRTGRTGRAKCTGKAFTFVTDDDLKVLHTLERHVGVELKCQTISGFDYDAEQKSPPPRQKKQFRKPYRKRRRARAS